MSFGTNCSHYQSRDTIPSIKNTIDQSFNLTFPIYFYIYYKWKFKLPRVIPSHDSFLDVFISSLRTINTLYLSCPLLLWLLGEYWFSLFHYVYDCNRPIAPILRQNRCNRCFLTCKDDDGILVQQVQLMNTYNGIEIPGIESRIRIESFSFEQRTMNKSQTENKWESSNEQINEQQQ
jgi:hypothetical protein